MIFTRRLECLIIMPCPIIGAELRIMDHWMDFVNFLFYFFFSKRVVFGRQKILKKNFPFCFCFCFCFFPISPKGREGGGGRISITSKSGPIGALTSSQKRRTRAALAPESIFKLMTSARDYGRSELAGASLTRVVTYTRPPKSIRPVPLPFLICCLPAAAF